MGIQKVLIQGEIIFSPKVGCHDQSKPFLKYLQLFTNQRCKAGGLFGAILMIEPLSIHWILVSGDIGEI